MTRHVLLALCLLVQPLAAFGQTGVVNQGTGEFELLNDPYSSRTVGNDATYAQAGDTPPTANAVQSIDATTLPDGKVVVRIGLKNALGAAPGGFTVGNPPRIALDLLNTGNAMGRKTVEANLGPLTSVNVIQAGNRTRLVLNLNKPVEYEASIDGKSLIVALGDIDPVVAPVDASPDWNWYTKRAWINQSFFRHGEIYSYLNLAGGVSREWDKWRLDLRARLDASLETFDSHSNLHQVKLDGDEITLMWTGHPQLRATAGYSVVRWGKTDEISPVDRVVAEDWTRPFEELADRRRAVPIMRLEYFGAGYTLDAIVRPWFRKAEMPSLESRWSPIDQQRGRILGFPDDPSLAYLVTNGTFIDDPDGGGGWGARISGSKPGIDWGFSAQRWRRSSPYYALDPSGATPRFDGKHPYSNVFGAEIAAALGTLTLRAEAAYLSDEPVTSTSLAYTTVPALEAVAGIDWWPGDRDFLVVMQIAGRRLDTGTKDVLDREHSLALTGSLRTEWGRGNWQARLRYLVGLDENDLYLNPAITWTGWASSQLTLGAHIFEGNQVTPGGYYDANDTIYIEWRQNL